MIPETYATAWTCLFRNLEIENGQLLVIRGATSSFGQAALKMAVNAGIRRMPGCRLPAITSETGKQSRAQARANTIIGLAKTPAAMISQCFHVGTVPMASPPRRTTWLSLRLGQLMGR